MRGVSGRAPPGVLLSRPLLCALLRQLVRRVTRSAAEELGEQPMLLLSPTELLDQQRPDRRRPVLLPSRALLLLAGVSSVPGGRGGGGGVPHPAPELLTRAKLDGKLPVAAAIAAKLPLPLLPRCDSRRDGAAAAAGAVLDSGLYPAAAAAAATSSGASSALQQQHLGHTDMPAAVAAAPLGSTLPSAAVAPAGAAAAASPTEGAAADVYEGADGL